MSHSEDQHPSREEREYKPPLAQSIYLRGLSDDTRIEDLSGIFEKYGPVSDIYIPRDHYSGRPRGFAYVQYKAQEDAERAMSKIEFLEIGGRQINIEWAKGERKSSQQMRRRDRSPPRGGRRHSSRSPPPRRYDRYDRDRSPPRRRRYDDDRSPPHSKRYASRSPPPSKRFASRSPPPSRRFDSPPPARGRRDD